MDLELSHNSLVNSHSKRFQGKVIVITASNCGIDQATALLFGREGARLAIHGSEESELRTTVHLLLDTGISDEDILVIQGAIDDDRTLNNLVERTAKKYGRIDILVNNSGGGTPQHKNNYNEDNFDLLFNINLKSITTLTRLVIPYLEKTKGSVVIVSSFGSQQAFADYAYYSNTKTALGNYCRSAAIKYVKKNIRVNNVNAGFITSRIVNGEKKEKINKFESNWIKNHVPMGRGGSADEIARVIAFLASEDASYITGACIVADGGVSIFSKPADYFIAS